MVLSVIARIACALMGAFSLIGFLHFGSLSIGMLGGFLALAAAVIPSSRPGSTDKRSTAILALATLGFMCEIVSIVQYYLIYDIPGNDHWWPGSIAFFGATAIMAAYGAITRARQSHVV